MFRLKKNQNNKPTHHQAKSKTTPNPTNLNAFISPGWKRQNFPCLGPSIRTVSFPGSCFRSRLWSSLILEVSCTRPAKFTLLPPACKVPSTNYPTSSSHQTSAGAPESPQGRRLHISKGDDGTRGHVPGHVPGHGPLENTLDLLFHLFEQNYVLGLSLLWFLMPQVQSAN